jgi:hypothetical protein
MRFPVAMLDPSMAGIENPSAAGLRLSKMRPENATRRRLNLRICFIATAGGVLLPVG